MNRDTKARVIIQSASLQGIPADEIVPKLLKLGFDRAGAEAAIRDYRMKTDIAFKLPKRRRRIIGLVLVGAGVALIVGTVLWELVFG